MLPKGETRKECFIVEEVRAWEECIRCHGTDDPISCPTCSGEGGRWHEAIKYPVKLFTNANLFSVNLGDDVVATNIYKSSFLIRRWEVCRSCRNVEPYKKFKRQSSGHHKFCGVHYGATDICSCEDKADEIPCNHCNGTGAEPDTAGEWKVE